MGEERGRVVGTTGGAGLVVASMIGAGIFGTSGDVAGLLGSGRDLMIAWVLGGLLALSAALCFAELGAAMPEAGGEYRYVRRLFGKRAGFLCGFCSFVAGFCAPIAGVALILGAYLEALGWPGGVRTGAAAVILLAALGQGFGLRGNARLNTVLAAMKGLILAGFGVAAFCVPATAGELGPTTEAPGVASGAFATALMLVSFAYTGWNAAAYLGGEMRDPHRSLPRALVLGTGGVMLLYLLVNAAFLRAASESEMAGVTEVGHLAATRLFGDEIGRFVSASIAVSLASTVLAFSMAGPRIPLAMAEEGQLPDVLTRRDARGVPRTALVLQTLIALGLLIGDPDQILIYVGMTLSLFAGLAVAGLFRLRRAEHNGGFRCPLHPLPALAFIGLSLVIVGMTSWTRPEAALATVVTLLAGLGLEALVTPRRPAAKN